MVLISIEGNIGAGKSSLLEELRARGYRTYPEPVDEWQEWLQRFYENKNRWAFSFQMMVLASFFQQGYAVGSFVERSCISCRQVFGQLLYNQGHLSTKEWDLFKRLCDLVTWQPNLVIYVHTPAGACLERIKERGRVGEDGIDAEYVGRIEFQYTNMLKYFGGETATLDGTKPTAALADEVEALLEARGWKGAFAPI
jgi:deoxyadenosine/deoxycytidine kinase